MANAIYPTFKNAILNGTGPDLDTDTIKMRLVDLTVDYTYSAAHEFVSSVTAYAGTTDQTITSLTVSGAVADSASTMTFTAVSQSASKTVGAVVIYKDTGVAGTSQLIGYYDNFTAITPNGSDIQITISDNILSIT